MTAACHIALGAVVETHVSGRGRLDGVVTEIVKAGRSPRRFVRGGVAPARRKRFVIEGCAYRVIRAAGEITVLHP